MKQLVPTLSALALMGTVPAFGSDFAEDLAIKPKAQIQMRDQFGASATNAAGADYNLYNGAVGDTESMRFSIRRARFGAEAKDTTGWLGVVQFRGGEQYDEGARANYVTSVTAGPPVTSTTSAQPRTIELYYAYVAKTFKVEDTEHVITFGLYKPFNNEGSISSSTYLFPGDRAIAKATEYRMPGIGYTLGILDTVKVGFDVMNGSGWGNTAATESTGTFTSARIEFSPGKEFMPKKKQESYAGAEGTHLLFGFDYQNDANYLNATGTTQSTVTTMGPDLLAHWNGLTALIDYRMRTTKVKTLATGVTAPDVKGSLMGIQAGYAMPLDGGLIIEPCLRYSVVDVDKDNANEGPTPFSKGEFAADKSGNEIGVGVNFYWNGHTNKTQFAYTSWTGEQNAAGDSAKAHVITLQHQLTF